MTLRALTIGIGAVFLAVAIVLAVLGQPLGLAVWLGINGAVVIGVVVIERSGYRTKHHADGDSWQPTGERFHDPTTGKLTEVYYNPTTGERDYKEI